MGAARPFQVNGTCHCLAASDRQCSLPVKTSQFASSLLVATVYRVLLMTRQIHDEGDFVKG